MNSKLPTIVKEFETQILQEWTKNQLSQMGSTDKISESELKSESQQFLNLFQISLQSGNTSVRQSKEWAPIRDYLSNLSRTRASQGFSPTETATFIFSLKKPLVARLRTEFEKSPAVLLEEVTASNELVDALGLYTTEAYQKGREELIGRQQEEMLELSTPVVKLWDGILALPMIGTLDSSRTQIVMESLLQKIVETESEIAIIDITGVPTVDTLVAQHLLKTVAAARLMGADCIISGIRPQIAQTIVHLAIDLGSIITKSSLADAFAVALDKRGLQVSSQRQKTALRGEVSAQPPLNH